MVKGLKKRTIMNVTITSPFWKRRRDQIVEPAIPYQCGVTNYEIDTTVPDDPAGNQLADNKSHAVANLKVAAGELDDEFHGMVFQDSDDYKWLEEAAYALAYHPDPELKALCDRTVDLIARAQQSDGYLDTLYSINGLQNRFTNLKDYHELYCFGHLAQAACARWAMQGERVLLDIACRAADCICRTFGRGMRPGYPGHPLAELALVQLIEVTGKVDYVQTADFFIRTRGTRPLFFDRERGVDTAGGNYF